GAIFGALLTSLILVAAVGSQKSQQVVMASSAISGLLMLVTGSAPGDKATQGVKSPRHRGLTLTPVLGMIAAGALAGLLMRTVPPLPGLLIAHWRSARP